MDAVPSSLMILFYLYLDWDAQFLPLLWLRPGDFDCLYLALKFYFELTVWKFVALS